MSRHRHRIGLNESTCDGSYRPSPRKAVVTGRVLCYPENIEREMKRLFFTLREQRYLKGLTQDAFVAEAAAFIATLNAIHPFREGNGRAQTTFLTLIAAQAGHPFDLDKLDPDTFLAAMVSSFQGDEGPLKGQLRLLVSSE